jgi:hypothetical protein
MIMNQSQTQNKTRSTHIETQHNYMKREQDKHIIKRKTQDVWGHIRWTTTLMTRTWRIHVLHILLEISNGERENSNKIDFNHLSCHK